MRIQLQGLPRGAQTFKHKCPASEYLDDGDSYPGSLDIVATVAVEGNALRLNLETEIEARLTCTRCCELFSVVLNMDAEYFFAFEHHYKASGSDVESAIIPANATSVDVSQEIRDTILLGLPEKIICKEDCLGLCSNCGCNFNKATCECDQQIRDPRWAALQKLKRQD